jgi:hypothetical protein
LAVDTVDLPRCSLPLTVLLLRQLEQDWRFVRWMVTAKTFVPKIVRKDSYLEGMREIWTEVEELEAHQAHVEG